MNRLYYGDCLTIMQEMKLGSVDLIYLDPPFKSERDYNAIYKTETGMPLPDQIEAFSDTWTLDEDRERDIRNMPILLRNSGVADDVAEFWKLWMNALRETQPRLLAYLSYMVPRLLMMKTILKPTGSIYLHCDPEASHYIKIMMDGIFGHDNFQNEIIWKRTSAHSDAKTMGSIHDTILYYTSTKSFTYNRQYMPYDKDYIEQRYKHQDSDGRRFMDDNLSAKGLKGRGYEYEYKGASSLWRVPLARMQELDEQNRLYFTRSGGIRIKRYLDEMKGLAVGDIWADIPPINSQAQERLGYATQKPVKLLERIIRASSNEGDTVLDPFCGCASTIEAAHKLGRQWIGIDIAIHAIKRVSTKRLQERLGLVLDRDFAVDGVPRNVEGAQHLWKSDKYQFQKWAVEQVNGFVKAKKTAYGGIDGRIYFELPFSKTLESMVIEVKGGKHVSVGDVRALHGVMERSDAQMAGLIVMHPPSDRQLTNFRKEMASAGDLEIGREIYPRMQLLTVPEIFEGKRFWTPPVEGKERHDQYLDGFETLVPPSNRSISQ